jgi:hypothetical protein
MNVMSEENRKIEEPTRTERHDAPGPEEPKQNQPMKTDKEIEEAGHKEGDEGEKKHSSAASINSIITGATGAVKGRMHTDTLGNTGTNVSYEGPTSTSPVGTGYNSGQSGTGSRISTSDSYDDARMEENKIGKDNSDTEKDII